MASPTATTSTRQRLVEHAGGKFIAPLTTCKLKAGDIRVFMHVGKLLKECPTKWGGFSPAGNAVGVDRSKVILVSSLEEDGACRVKMRWIPI
ncbi:hypothetical protein HDU98_008246 [Podochytrium sp. JEL0797]|nr:hypothetical protein HDU98_008246 [Podochytrium sp. JEL0797]